MKWLMSCVLPGVAEVFAKDFLLHNMLIRLDFPTFDLPMKAYSGFLGGGQRSIVGLLVIKLAFLISTRIKNINDKYTVFFNLNFHKYSVVIKLLYNFET